MSNKSKVSRAGQASSARRSLVGWEDGAHRPISHELMDFIRIIAQDSHENRKNRGDIGRTSGINPEG